MNSIEQVQLLAGIPIPMSDSSCLIYSKTLRDIALVGVNKYFRYLNLLTITKKDIKNLFKQDDVEPFDFILFNSILNEEFKNEFIEALKYFIKEDVLFVSEMESFIIGKFEEERMLNKDNFGEFQIILKLQNFLEEKNKSNGENDIAKKIKEKIAKGREKVAQIKGINNDNINLSDLIGSLAINTSLGIDRIWDITYYAFNDQFRRMRMLEQYETSLQSIMAGADPKKVKLEDWIKSIQ